MLLFRLANTILEPVWSRHHIDSVQVTMAEDFGVAGRAGFYDEVGTLRDVVQNHLLQLVALVAMEHEIDSWRWAPSSAIRAARGDRQTLTRSSPTGAVGTNPAGTGSD